ncbi:MAG TPA: hypothetical protein VGO36_06930 [Solirubrobacterales bacterium]|nr:hypothetical protein [Solirubrobacterales bacterium]
MLAICESAGHLWGYLLPVGLFMGWVAVVYALFRRSAPEDRTWLIGLLVGCMAIAPLVMSIPNGFDGDGDYFARFLTSVAIAIALGLGIGLLRRRALLRTVGVALVGDVFAPGLLVLALIWVFAGDGFCLD